MKALQHIFMVGGLILILPAMAGSGYLSTVGPVPLRLGTKVEPPAGVGAVLPPLDPPQPSPPVLEPPQPIVEATKSDETEPVVYGPSLPVEVLGPPAPDPSALAPVGSSMAERGAITAALLKFFHTGTTNGPSKSVLVPVGFSPPQPLAAPSSTATFKTSP